MYDENNQHYNCITDISAFLGVREFCFNCLKGFHHKATFECHECAKSIKKKTTNPKHQGKMLKELGHFLRRDFTKGSEGEIKDKVLRLEKPEKAIKNILEPTYIIYDFETDTHTDIHIPNHVEVL